MFVKILYIAVRNLRIELKKEYAKSLTDLTQEDDWQIKQRNIKHFLIRFLWKLPRSLRIGMYVIDGFGGIHADLTRYFHPCNLKAYLFQSVIRRRFNLSLDFEQSLYYSIKK